MNNSYIYKYRLILKNIFISEKLNYRKICIGWVFLYKVKKYEKKMLLRGIYIYGIKILKKGNVNVKFKK